MGKITNIPDKIYLQVDPEDWIEGDLNDIEFLDLDEITWCMDGINNSDIAYLKEELTHKVADALANLLQACWQADAQAELPAEVDGSLMDAARIILDEIPGYVWRSP